MNPEPLNPYSLYFPFADKKIGYDCIVCGAGCCVDGLLGVGPNEGRFLTERYPGLHFFARETSSQDGFLFYEKFKPSCWFLGEDHYCSIEKEFGRERKPVLCRTHPVYFTPIFTEGIFLVWLAPVCHWTTAKDLSAATGIVSRDEIQRLHKELTAVSYYDTLPVSQQVMNAVGRLATVADLRTIIRAEERIRDAWTDFDHYHDYLSWQLAYSAAFLAGRDPEVNVTRSACEKASASMGELSRMVQSFLGVEEVDHSPENERVLFLFTPILRLAWLGLIVEIPESIMESEINSHSLYHSVPKALLVMSILSNLFAKVTAPSQKPFDYNTLIQLYLHFYLKIFSLACFNGSMDLGHVKMDMARVKDRQNVERLIRSVDPFDRAPIGNIITAFCRDFRTDEKMTFLEDIGRCLMTVDFLPDFFNKKIQ